MNFNQIIKQEWKKEFPDALGEDYFNSSIFNIVYGEIIERVCVKVWNQAIETCANNVEVICDSSDIFQAIDKQSILKLKINEQRTDTTEV